MRGFFIKPEKLNRNDSHYTDCYEKAVVFLSHLFQPVWFGRFFPTYMVIIFFFFFFTWSLFSTRSFCVVHVNQLNRISVVIFL